MPDTISAPNFPRRRFIRSGVGLTAFSVLGAGTALLSACGGGGNDDPASPAALAASAVSAPTLTGRAILPADSFVAGPTTGQFISGGDSTRATDVFRDSLPLVGKQPMQGFSAMIPSRVAGVFYVMQDNGFGGRVVSPDALQHIYAVRFDWDAGKVVPVDFRTGAVLASFTPDSYIRLSDPNRRLGYAIVADMTNYPGLSVSPAGQTLPVDPLIQTGRLLTGYDMDPESLQLDADGNFWIGEELGPFLLKFDPQGRLLSREVAIPNLRRTGSNPLVQSPSNPSIQSNLSVANIANSGGFESMAINTSKTKLYAMFEKELTGDDLQRRVIVVLDLTKPLVTPAFDAQTFSYRVGSAQRIGAGGKVDTEFNSVNDMMAINDREFLVIEKDSGAGDVRTGRFAASGTARNAARFKRIFKIDLTQIDSDGYLRKEELVDLLNLKDPLKIGGDATIDGVFAFPMESVETVTIVDAQTLLVVNDNNYPGGSSSRVVDKADAAEFIRIRLPRALALPG